MSSDKSQNILVVGDYNRSDFLYFFQSLKSNHQFYFIEFALKKEVKNRMHEKVGKSLFWKDFRDAFQLLERIQPSKVVFFFIESFNHVALNMVCKQQGIPTIHLEHGIRDFKRIEILDKQRKQTKAQNRAVSLQKVLELPSRLKNRSFFQNTLKRLPDESRAFLQEYFNIRGTHSIFDTFKKINSEFRIADHYISFSKRVFRFHQLSDHLKEDHSVYFTGIPQFDSYANLQPDNPSLDLVFIDQPFPEQELYGWDQEFRHTLIESIHRDVLDPLDKRMLIKVHPLSDLNIWEELDKKHERISLIREDDLKSTVQHNCVIIGFASTLLLPLIAQPHTLSFSLNIHPDENDHYGKLLTDSGAIDMIQSADELRESLEDHKRVFDRQVTAKKQFIEDWMYKFDGESTARFERILIDEIN